METGRNKEKNSGCLSLGIIVMLIMAALKYYGYIHCSWLVVWLPVILFPILKWVIIGLIIGGIIRLFKNREH